MTSKLMTLFMVGAIMSSTVIFSDDQMPSQMNPETNVAAPSNPESGMASETAEQNQMTAESKKEKMDGKREIARRRHKKNKRHRKHRRHR